MILERFFNSYHVDACGLRSVLFRRTDGDQRTDRPGSRVALAGMMRMISKEEALPGTAESARTRRADGAAKK